MGTTVRSETSFDYAFAPAERGAPTAESRAWLLAILLVVGVALALGIAQVTSGSEVSPGFPDAPMAVSGD